MTNPNVSVLDFDLLKSNFRDYLRSQTAFSDYPFEGSGMSILLDILAYNSHYQAFYSQLLANEMFFDSAALRSSVVSLAKLLGYTPRSVTSSQANVSITITPTDDATLAVISSGTLFYSVINNVTYNFVTTQTYSASLNAGVFSFPNVMLCEGTPYTYRITVDSTIPNQKFVIPNSSVDSSTISVIVQNSQTDSTLTTFVPISDFLSLTGTENVYSLQETGDEKTEVCFGDGILGSALEDGNIVIISYIISTGSASNGANLFTPAVRIAGYSAGNTVVTTLSVAAGGLDIETVDQIKFSAPKSYAAQGRAVTVSDYETLLEEQYTNLDSISIWGGEDNNPPQYGKVFISIKPVDGYVVTNNIKQSIAQNILAKRNVVGVIPVLVDPDYTNVIVNTIVKFNPLITSTTSGEIQLLVNNTIVNFGQVNIDKFSKELRYSKLLAAIDSAHSSITSNLTNIKLKKSFRPQLDVMASYTMTFNTPVVPGSVTSSLFVSTQDINMSSAYASGNTYTITDDSLGNLTITQHTLAGSDAVVRTAGTIDYSTGILTIKSIIPHTANADGTLNIIVTPSLDDIVPSQNTILFISPLDVTVTCVGS